MFQKKKKKRNEGRYVYTELSHFAAPYKLTQHCDAAIRQYKLILKSIIISPLY